MNKRIFALAFLSVFGLNASTHYFRNLLDCDPENNVMVVDDSVGLYSTTAFKYSLTGYTFRMAAESLNQQDNRKQYAAECAIESLKQRVIFYAKNLIPEIKEAAPETFFDKMATHAGNHKYCLAAAALVVAGAALYGAYNYFKSPVTVDTTQPR